MKSVKKVLALLMALVMMLALSACEEGSTAPAESGEHEVRTDVNLIIEEQLVGMDIMQTNKTFTRTVLLNVYEGLTHDNEDGTWRYQLADEITASEDALCYHVKLKEGVKFHNGDEMKASDAAYSLNRAKTMSYLGAYCANIDFAEATGDYTLDVHMTAPYAPMMTDFANLPIISEKVAKESGDDKMMTEYCNCATGPYKVVEFNDTVVKLEAFEEYYLGAPQIKNVTYYEIMDASTRLIKFEAGEVDALNVPTANWNNVVNSGKYNTKIIPANHYSFLEMNLYGKYTSDLKIRQAIAYAIDPEGINQMAYDGLAVVCNRLADPAMVFGAPEETFTYSYDPEKSKALLAEAGYPDGLDIGEMIAIGGGYYEKMAVAIQGYLEAVGIHTHIVTYDSATCGNKCRSNDYELTPTGHPLASDYNFMREKWHSASNTATHNDFNDPYIDEMFDRGAAELDPEKRKEIYAELDPYLMQYCTNVPIFHKVACWAWDKDLTFTANPNFYYIYEWSWN